MMTHSPSKSVLLLLVILATIAIMFIDCAPSQKYPVYYDMKSHEWIAIEQVNKMMADRRAVFVGEYHDHQWGHLIEYELLQLFYNSSNVKNENINFGLSMEMFERDVQQIVDGYMKEQVNEKFFLENSRPWPNYETDYKRLVEFAKQNQFQVIAANVPRRYAAMVVKQQENILFNFPELEKSYIGNASSINASLNEYYHRFYELMKQSGMPDDQIMLYYRAQCIKDDVMAYSINQFLSIPSSKIINFSGSFHVDYHLGLYSKVHNNDKMLISIVRVEDPSKPIDIVQYEGLADVIIFAPQSPTKLFNNS